MPPRSTKRKPSVTQLLDDDPAERKVRPKKVKTRWQQSTVKQTLAGVLKLNGAEDEHKIITPNLKPHIEAVVQSVNILIQDAHRLLALHIHRCLDARRHVRLDQNELYGVFQLVAGQTSQFPLLNASYDIYATIFSPRHLPLERTHAVLLACAWEIKQFLINAKTNIATNFFKDQCKWVKLQLYRFWSQSEQEWPDSKFVLDCVIAITSASFLEHDVKDMHLGDSQAFNDYCVDTERFPVPPRDMWWR